MLNPPQERPPGYFMRLTANVLQLLSTLLATYIKESDQTIVISPDTKRQLQPLLRAWGKRYHHSTFLGEVTIRALSL